MRVFSASLSPRSMNHRAFDTVIGHRDRTMNLVSEPAGRNRIKRARPEESTPVLKTMAAITMRSSRYCPRNRARNKGPYPGSLSAQFVALHIFFYLPRNGSFRVIIEVCRVLCLLWCRHDRKVLFFHFLAGYNNDNNGRRGAVGKAGDQLRQKRLDCHYARRA